MVDQQRRSGETALKNVALRAVSAIGEVHAELAEIDFLVGGRQGVRISVSAKADIGEFDLRRERELLDLLYGTPADVDGLRRAVRVHDSTMGEDTLADIVEAVVAYDGGQMSLEQFRLAYPGHGHAGVVIKSVSPAGSAADLQLPVTLAELNAEIDRAVAARVQELERAAAAGDAPPVEQVGRNLSRRDRSALAEIVDTWQDIHAAGLTDEQRTAYRADIVEDLQAVLDRIDRESRGLRAEAARFLIAADGSFREVLQEIYQRRGWPAQRLLAIAAPIALGMVAAGGFGGGRAQAATVNGPVQDGAFGAAALLGHPVVGILVVAAVVVGAAALLRLVAAPARTTVRAALAAARTVVGSVARIAVIAGTAVAMVLATASPAYAATTAAAAAGWPQVVGGLVGVAAVVGVVALVRVKVRAARAKRWDAWTTRTNAWADLATRTGTLSGAASPGVVLPWVLRLSQENGRALLGDLAHGGSDGATRAALSAWLAGLPDRTVVGRVIDDLVAAGLLRSVDTPDGRAVEPTGAFAGLWAQVPAELRTALAADPSTVLGDPRLDDRTAEQLSSAVLHLLQDVVWAQAEAAPRAWAWVPLWLRGGRAALLAHFAQLRVVSREIDGMARERERLQRRLAVATSAAPRIEGRGRARAAATQRLLAAERPAALVVAAIRWSWAAARHVREVRKLPAELRGERPARAVAVLTAQLAAVDDRLVAAQERERAAAVPATAAAAAAGYSRGQVTSLRTLVMQGWKARFRAPTAGAIGAFAGQAAGAPTYATDAFAQHLGQSVPWVLGQGAIGTSITAGAGLAAASLGDRLIRTMVPTVALGALGAAALVVIGVPGAAALFLPAVILLGMMGTAGGLARGRMDRYHPAAVELKDSRNGQYELAFKAVQFVLPIVITQGVAIVGVPATSLLLAGIAAGLTAATWWVLRGVGRGAAPRAPPKIGESIKGAVAQLLGTPRGLLRLAASIPLFTALTGLYAAALGGAMVSEMALINDPTQAVFATTGAAVTALVTVRGLATMFVGPLWVPLKRLLGSPGAIARTLGRDVPVGAVDEARVLTAVAVLSLVLVLPVAWLAIAPGLIPFGVVLTAGAVLTAWARMPVSLWKEGATGASLNNTAKAGSIALGAALSATVLGGFSTTIKDQVALGAPVADLVASANLHLALLAIPVLVAPILLARLIGKLRIGTLDELRARMLAIGGEAVAGTATTITGKLSSRGLDDIGSAAALFVDTEWSPRIAPTRRLALRDWRRKSVGLTADEHDLLLSALTAPGRGPSRFATAARALRDRVIRSTGTAFLASAGWGLGVLATAGYAMALLSQALGLAPGPLTTALMIGNALGLVLFGPRWSVSSRRVFATLSMVVVAAVYPLFAAGTVGAFVAAFVLGVTASGWAGLSFLTEEWRNRAGVGDRAIALMLFGSVLVAPALLAVVGAVSVVAGLGVLSAAGAVSALTLWRTVPAEPTDRARPADLRLRATLLAPLRTFRLPVVRTVALLYSAVAVAVTAFDGFWRAALAGAGVSTSVATLIGFSVAAGGAVGLVAVLLDGLRAGSGAPGLIERNPVGFLTTLAALLAAGGLVAVLGSSLGPLGTIVTIGLAAYLVEAGATGAVLPVQTVIRSRVEPAEQGMAMTAVTIAKFAVQVVVSIVGTFVWIGTTPLPAGWPGIAAIAAVGGLAAVVVARKLGGRSAAGPDDASRSGGGRVSELRTGPPDGRPWWPIVIPFYGSSCDDDCRRSGRASWVLPTDGRERTQ